MSYRILAHNNAGVFGKVQQAGVALYGVLSAVGRNVDDDLMFAVGKRETLHLWRKSQIEERNQQFLFTCLNDLQRAIVLGMNIVDGIQTRAVIVINALPIPIELSLYA